jgi:5'-deoxynucleotidase YfbR-like HD superfamily hydrolase
MTWMITASGQKFDVLNLDAARMLPRDIAHSLAQINRFTGAAVRPYSVAEHSLLVVEIMERELHITEPRVLLAGLLHDGHEAYISDLSTPMKDALDAMAAVEGRQSDWDRLEARHADLLRERFGLTATFERHGSVIKDADLVALSTEWVHLMPATAALPQTIESHPAAEWVELASRAAMTWHDWRDAWLDRFEELSYAVAEGLVVELV